MADLFVLVKVVLVVVAPETEMRYGVLAESVSAAGTEKVILRVVPTIVVTVDAAVVAVGPAPETCGSNLTVTEAGRIVPAGKPLPVRLTGVPGCAVDGDAGETRVTD